MSTRCANCEEHLSGDYCFACGQPRKSPIMSVGELTSEYLRDVFSLDSRASRTLTCLMLRPGAMTADDLSGRRHAYTPPVRLHLWYLYRAMRTVYGQGRLLTALKFSMLSLAYLIGLTGALAVGLILAVESFTR